jgi:hypothetical protein
VAALDAAAAKVWKLWLIPSLFDGFDPAVWHVLGLEQVTVLEHVSRYREVAERDHVAGVEPSGADLLAARIAFRHMYHATRPLLFDRSQLALVRDCRRIVLDRTDPGVQRWAVSADQRFGENWSGEPSLDVWLVVEDSTPDNDDFWAEWLPFRMRLQGRLWERVERERRVIVSIRTVSEVLERITGVPA